MSDIGIKKNQKAVTRYYTTVCFGYATSVVMLEKFKEATLQLQHKKILQLSMDGPNVNWKFFELFKNEFNPGDAQLLETGSCSLHILNGAFKDGAKNTTWNIEGLLRYLYLLFHDSPARRADFQQVNGVSCIFPMKFCGHRWLENKPVICRVLTMWPDIVKYVSAVSTNSTVASHVRQSHAFTVIKDMVNDPLILPKLNFYSMMANSFYPVLNHFQSDFPMLPFMYESHMTLIKSLLKKVVKDSVMDSAITAQQFCNIDVHNAENLKKKSDTDIGTGALSALNKKMQASTTNSSTRSAFYSQCQKFVIACIEKLADKNPLKFRFVRHCSCLSPVEMARNTTHCLKLFKRCAAELHSSQRLSSTHADLACAEFDNFLQTVLPLHKEQFENFHWTTDRLDTFFVNLIQQQQRDAYENLLHVIQIVCCLFHGNAAVERGFSVSYCSQFLCYLCHSLVLHSN